MNGKTLSTLAIMIIFIFRIQNVILGITKAINICAFSIIPSLFIFMVFSDVLTSLILNDSKVIIPVKYLVLTIGTLCGFPIGATVCDRLIQNNVITQKDAKKLIPFCNNASPAYILGTIGTTIYKNKKIGVIILVAQFLSSALPVFFLKIKSAPQVLEAHPFSIIDLFCKSLEKTSFNMLKVCASVCFFSAIIEVLKDYSLIFSSVILEITNGVNFCASLFEANKYLSVGLCGFCCGFSGICVLTQIVSTTSYVRISFPDLLIKKLFQGILCAVFSLIALYLFF